jgi:hypothetical protein
MLAPWLSMALLALGAGCSLKQPAAAVGCRTDAECGPGLACAGGTCIQSGSEAMIWAVEIVPTSDSTAAATELEAFSIGAEPAILRATAKVTVTGNLAPGSALTGDSHVVATLSPVIPGRQDLQFEADWAPPADGGKSQFTLVVPANVIGQTATLRILPLPPGDQAQPPVSPKVSLGAQGDPLVTQFDVPISNNYYFIRGRLVSALQQPIGGFVARAFQGSQLISTVNTIPSTGLFRLTIPVEATNGSNHLVTVELVPSDASSPNPRFTTLAVPVQADVDLGDLVMPAFGAPNYFRFVVIDPNLQPVSDAMVTLQTAISNDTTGTAKYVRSGRTDADGRIDLALLPGTAAQARTYDISVIPPASSPFGIACLNNFPITVGTTGTGPGYGDPQVVKSIRLPARVALGGTILSATGMPVAGVSIAATRTEAADSEVCATAPAALPATGSSARDGSYQLLLDPGTYRIDYDPPAGGPVPRLTENRIVVPTEGSVERVVQMLPGALVRGVAQDQDGNALASAGVRFFEILCSGDDACFGANRVEPLLGAETHTDADGKFSAVLPIQLPAPN